MSVLVTGAAGFVGSHVAEALLTQGCEVVGLDSFDDFYAPTIKHRNLTIARQHDRFLECSGDLLDEDVLRNLPDHIEEVIHLAARAGVRPSIEHPELYARVNVVGTARILEFMNERDIKKLIFASSSSVYGNSPRVPFSETDPVDMPISPYAATKVAGELLSRTFHELYGIGVVALRLFTVYGPRQRPDLAIHKFARLMRQGAPIPMFGDGSTRRDYTHVRDTLAGVLGARRYLDIQPGTFEIVNLGESRTVSLAEMIDVLSQELGVQANIRRLPPQPGDVEVTFADIEKARRLLGYAPCVDFRSGVRDFVQWLEAPSTPS